MNPAAVGLPNILTIEDDPVLGAYVHEHLGRCGFQVTWCQNGQQGLAMAREQAFDLVLMDILLPGLDGFVDLDSSTPESFDPGNPDVGIGCRGRSRQRFSPGRR